MFSKKVIKQAWNLVVGFKILEKIRGEIIQKTIYLEHHVDLVIGSIFFGIVDSANKAIFDNLVLQQQLSFSQKLKILENMIKINNPKKGYQAIKWLNKLEEINTVRNFLAHGTISDTVLGGRKLAVTLVKKGKNKDYILNKISIKKLRRQIDSCFVFLVGRNEDIKGLKNYFG